jgi:cAMP-dependent protein kinase regulator
VDCLKGHPEGHSKGFLKVRTLKQGDHFGELALINNMKRSLSVRVSSEEGCNLLSLDRETFTRILGSINDHLKKSYD